MANTSISAIALGAVLALGLGALPAAPAAAKKKDDAAQAPKYNLSPTVQTAAGAAQKARDAGDFATAQSTLEAAKAEIKTEDDSYIIYALQQEIAQKTGNDALRRQAFMKLVDNPKQTDSNRAIMNLSLAQDAYTANDFPTAEKYLRAAIALHTTEPNAVPLLVEIQAKQGQAAPAIQTLIQAIDAQKAAGQTPPATWYGRGVAIAYAAKQPALVQQLATRWLVAYPTKDNWRDTLMIYRDLGKLDPDTDLDTMRLMRAIGAMKGQGDYVEYGNAVYLRYPSEAKGVLEEGSKAGQVNLTAGSPKEIYGLASQRLAADKASLAASEAAARGPKGTGKQALAMGDAFLGYADYAKAADLYKLALTKGGVDAALVNTRLAIALARLGQKDAAKQALATITTGPRAPLAQYLAIWIDQMA